MINSFRKKFVRAPRTTQTLSLAVPDQDLIASVADFRTIGLQTCQHSHGVLVGRLAVLLDCWCAGGAVLRRSLLLRLSQCNAPPRRATVKSNLCSISGPLDQLSELLAGIKHAGLHRAGGDAEDERTILDGPLVVVDQINDFAMIRRQSR
jgi:hypothetical protein